jgi:hypothetical protein
MGKVKKEAKKAIKDWIDNNMSYPCIIVFIDSEAANRK